jgi:hypothetical protein
MHPVPTALILGPFSQAYYDFQDQLFAMITPSHWSDLMVAPFKIIIDQVEEETMSCMDFTRFWLCHGIVSHRNCPHFLSLTDNFYSSLQRDLLHGPWTLGISKSTGNLGGHQERFLAHYEGWLEGLAPGDLHHLHCHPDDSQGKPCPIAPQPFEGGNRHNQCTRKHIHGGLCGHQRKRPAPIFIATSGLSLSH